jgi:hypothetical protein
MDFVIFEQLFYEEYPTAGEKKDFGRQHNRCVAHEPHFREEKGIYHNFHNFFFVTDFSSEIWTQNS